MPKLLGALLAAEALPPLCSLACEDGGFALEGLAAAPPTGMRSREVQYVFVNRRPLARRDRSRLLWRTCGRAAKQLHISRPRS